MSEVESDRTRPMFEHDIAPIAGLVVGRGEVGYLGLAEQTSQNLHGITGGIAGCGAESST